MARAMMKPPRNSRMIGFEKGAAAPRMSLRPISGKSTSGSRAVTGIGMASVIQKTAINAAAPAVRQPSGERPEGRELSSVAASRPGPGSSRTTAGIP